MAKDISSPIDIRPLIWVARILRNWEWGNQIVSKRRDRFMLGVISRLHTMAIHEVRDYLADNTNLEEYTAIYKSMRHISNGCRDVMADLLEVKKELLHCTIKMTYKDEDGIWKVFTLGRSDGCPGREEIGKENLYPISYNSDFASLIGYDDRKNKWKVPYSCFICNDLKNHHERHDCSKEYLSHYNATMVFPLRCRSVHHKQDCNIIGYLTFDTKKDKVLSHAPCIYHNSRELYEENIAELSIFHLGAIMADVIAMVLYSKQLADEEDADEKD